MRHASILALLVSLALTVLGAVPAAASYSLKPLLKLGDKIGELGDVTIKADGEFELGMLNNLGQMTLVTENADGGEMLVQYSDGKGIPIVVRNKPVFTGSWPNDVGVLSPASMNQAGNIAFSADVAIGGFIGLGTFLWNFETQQFTPIVVSGLPSVFGLTYERGGNWITTINNNNEVGLVSSLRNEAGELVTGDFLYLRDGRLVSIVLPDQLLPDGRIVIEACNPSLDDNARVALVVRRKGDDNQGWNAYQWENGRITAIATIGISLPGGGTLASVLGVWVNNANRNILLLNSIDVIGGPLGLYLSSNGSLKQVLIPGQSLPGGGFLRRIQDFGISAANDLGQHVVLAVLNDNSTGAYLMDADGTLSLILKSGMTTDQGELIRNVGQGAGLSTGVALNKQGQVIVTLRIGDGVDTVTLLSPVTQ